MQTIQEILQSSDYVICDTSVMCGNNDWYTKGVYGTEQFQEIDKEVLQGVACSLGFFSDLLTNKKIINPQEISTEIKRMKDIVRNKISDLERGTYTDLRKQKWRRNRTERTKQEVLLHEICNLFHKLQERTRSDSIFPKGPEYNQLEKITLKISECAHSKIDYRWKHIHHRRAKKHYDLCTDEKMIALAFYMTDMQETEGGILTKDDDVRRLAVDTLSYLSKSKILRMNQVAERARKIGIKIYSPVKQNYFSCIFNSSEHWLKSKKLFQRDIQKIDEEMINYSLN